MTSNILKYLLLIFLTQLFDFGHGANPFLKEKPSFIKTCQFADPEFVKCNTEQVQGLFGKLNDGLPEIGIQPLDPLKITKIDIVSGEGPVSIQLSLNDVVIKGFHDAIVEYNSVDPKTYQFKTKLRVPKLKIDGLYKSQGRILIVPLNGQGEASIDCRDMTVDAISQVSLYKKKDWHFYNVTAIDVDFDMQDLKIHLSNLFDGNKELEEGTNKYLNQNWKDIAKAFKPVLADTIRSILLAILSKFFNSVPAEYFESDVQ